MYSDIGLSMLVFAIALLNKHTVKNRIIWDACALFLMISNLLFLFLLTPYLELGFEFPESFGVALIEAGFFGLGYWLYRNKEELEVEKDGSEHTV